MATFTHLDCDGADLTGDPMHRADPNANLTGYLDDALAARGERGADRLLLCRRDWFAADRITRFGAACAGALDTGFHAFDVPDVLL